MKNLPELLAIAALTPMLVACGPSDEKLCTHYWSLYTKDMNDAGHPPPEQATQEFMNKCLKDVERDKEKLGAIEFNKAAKCIMAADELKDTVQCWPPRRPPR